MLRALVEWKGVILGLSAVLFVGLLLSRHLVGPKLGEEPSVGKIEAKAAAEHVGDRATVCGQVVETSVLRDVDGQPTFLNLGDENPNQAFTVVIWGEDRARWSPPPEEQFAGRETCVTGEIEAHEGIPQIVVSRPYQIQML